MCTYEETKKAVNEVIHAENEQGETVIGREVNRHLDDRVNGLIRYINLRYGIGLIMLSFALGGGWYNLQSRLAATESEIEDTVSREVQEQIDDEQDRRIDELKTDVQNTRKNTEEILRYLRN